MRSFLILMNLISGVNYVQFASFLGADLFRIDKSERKKIALNFALPLILIYATCAGHHLEHALHLSVGDNFLSLEAPTILLQGLMSSTWIFLRYERIMDGSGERLVSGILNAKLLLSFAMAYFIFLFGSGLWMGIEVGENFIIVQINLFVMLMYSYIGGDILLRNLRTKKAMLSSLATGTYFIFCSFSHFIYGLSVLSGTVQPDNHMYVIDTLSLFPAGWFILATIRSRRFKNV